jgi:hypothetical protein
MFRDRREIEGLRGASGEVVLVEGAGLATADGMFMARHQENCQLYASFSSSYTWLLAAVQPILT